MACEMCWLNCCYLDLNLLAGVVYKAFRVFGAGGDMRMIWSGLQLRWLLRGLRIWTQPEYAKYGVQGVG